LDCGTRRRHSSGLWTRFCLILIDVYIDDILIASSSAEEHMRHLEILFERLQEYGSSSTRSSACSTGT